LSLVVLERRSHTLVKPNRNRKKNSQPQIKPFANLKAKRKQTIAFAVTIKEVDNVMSSAKK
jgi:hypothetical protein